MVETDKKIFFLSTLCDDIIFPPEASGERNCEVDTIITFPTMISNFNEGGV